MLSFCGGNYSTERYDAIIPLIYTLHPLPDQKEFSQCQRPLGSKTTTRSCHTTSHPAGHSIRRHPERSGGDGEIRTHGTCCHIRQVSNLLPSATRPRLLCLVRPLGIEPRLGGL